MVRAILGEEQLNRIFQCEACGATMEYSPEKKCLVCPHCGSEKPIANTGHPVQENRLTGEEMASMNVKKANTAVAECQGCGAKIEFAGSEFAKKCPYCGSNLMLSQRQEGALEPDGIVPFRYDKQAASQMILKWIGSRWWVPSSLKRMYQADKLTGVYQPYYTFDVGASATYTAMGGRDRVETYKNSKGQQCTRVHTDWYHTRGSVNCFINDMLVSAGSRLDRDLYQEVSQFGTVEGVVPYSEEYLAGFGSECCSVPLEQANREAVQKMRQYLQERCRQDVLRHYDKVRDVQMDMRLQDRTYKYILAPIYATSYRYGGKNYPVLMNGQTGEIKGKYPLSIGKIAAAVVAGIAALGLLYWFSEGDVPSTAAVNLTQTAPVSAVYQQKEDYLWDCSQDSLPMWWNGKNIEMM